MKKRILTFLMAVILLLPTFAACSESGTNNEKEQNAADGQSAEVTAQNPTEEEPEIGLDTAKLQYADRDYGGYSYRIADRASGDWMTFDVYS
ncbi:MAG: hypothetical protein IKZ41_00130, partial [Clostridia bacterium]|nr:hypothetical protein [Clostridia bacterium]